MFLQHKHYVLVKIIFYVDKLLNFFNLISKVYSLVLNNFVVAILYLLVIKTFLIIRIFKSFCFKSDE